MKGTSGAGSGGWWALWRAGSWGGSDWAVGLLLLLAGSLAGFFYLRDQANAAFFWKFEFVPAVMLGCGHGFVDIDRVDDAPGLREFMQRQVVRKVHSFDCANLPADVAVHPPNNYQRLHVYLMGLVGLVWQVTGVHWAALNPVMALFHGLTVLFAYGFFRLGCGRLVAAALAGWVLVSSQFLWQLKMYRDYIKAPFLVGLFLVIGLLARGPWSPRRTLWLAVAGGVLTGTGLFRVDLNIVIPVVILTLLFFQPGDWQWRWNLLAVALYLAAYGVAGYPVIRALAEGGTNHHVLVTGLGNPYMDNLHLENGPYDTGYMDSDHYTESRVRGYSERYLGRLQPPSADDPNTWIFPAYQEVARALFLEHMKLLPADLLARGLASLLAVADRGLVKRGGVAVLLAAVAALTWLEWRLGLLALLAGGYFLCYPALQFNMRHFFPMIILPLWATGFLLNGALVWGGGALARRWLGAAGWFPPLSLPAGGLWRALVLPAGSVVVLAGTLWTARQWQQAGLLRYFEALDRTPIQTLGWREVPLPSGMVRLEFDDFPRFPRAVTRNPQEDYLKVTLTPAADCGQQQVTLTYRYATEATEGFTRRVSVTLGQEPTRQMQPVYGATWNRFLGVELPVAQVRCIAALQRIPPGPHLPLFLPVTLASGWREAPLYQQFRPGPAPVSH
ncbi:MAG: hypothetical protein HQL82_00080 [Magnetococcales bacterium]|nr:hypothetical protein [Magnetococcales bacterium]